MLHFAKLAEACRAAGITEAEIYRVTASGSSVSTFNGKADQNVLSHTEELYIRGVRGGHIASVYAERDDDEEIPEIVARLCANTAIVETDEPYFIFGGSETYPTLPEETHDFSSYSQGDKLALCRKMEDFVRSKSEFVSMTQAEIDVEIRTVTIENTSGLSVARSEESAAVVCVGVISKDGDQREGFYFDRVKNFSEIDYAQIEERAVRRPLSAIGAKSLPSATYPVVFENSQFAGLLSCFMPMFSADAVIKKCCLLGDKLGEKVFGDNITLVDDPLLESSYRRVTFDDEGVATFPKTIVEKGVLKTFFHSLKTAEMLSAAPTGNGFKDNAGDIRPRPVNLCLKGGDKTFEELIAPIKEGVFITAMMGQHAGVNAESGSFNLQASGYRIVDGRIADPVTLIVVSGNILDVLKNVVAIADDTKVSGLVACGSVHVKALAVSGT